MSATIIPTFFHNKSTSEDFPVWKIISPNGREFYCQRVSVKGLVPLTVTGPSSFTKDNGLVICGAKIPLLSNKPSSYIITSKDGFRVPRSWYGNPGQTTVDLNPPPPPAPKDTKSFNEENYPSLSGHKREQPRPFVSYADILKR